MLSFSTEFPVEKIKTSLDFLQAVQSWLLGSPHTKFTQQTLLGFIQRHAFVATSEHEKIESFHYSQSNDERAAIRYSSKSDGIIWKSELVFSRNEFDSWVGVRTSRESLYPSAQLPAAKKPIFVQTVLRELGGGQDGELLVQSTPHCLDEAATPLAARCILGQAGCHLPVVYLSTEFQGGYTLQPQSLAHALAGMAHVLVEPSRDFSIRLMAESHSQNIYGGDIGIYWPKDGKPPTFFHPRETQAKDDLQQLILEEIRSALTHRRAPSRVTWSSIQARISHHNFEQLKSQGSSEVQAFVDAFDQDLRAKDAQLAEAEQEIERLKAEIRKYQSHGSAHSGLTLQTGNEQDLYPNELQCIVLDALSDAIHRVTQDSRRQHILQSLVQANPNQNAADVFRNRLKNMLSDYRSMDPKIRSELLKMGFSISEDGKHYKIIFKGDERYTFPMPKSGSDFRGGKNLAADLSRLLF